MLGVGGWRSIYGTSVTRWYPRTKTMSGNTIPFNPLNWFKYLAMETCTMIFLLVCDDIKRTLRTTSKMFATFKWEFHAVIRPDNEYEQCKIMCDLQRFSAKSFKIVTSAGLEAVCVHMSPDKITHVELAGIGLVARVGVPCGIAFDSLATFINLEFLCIRDCHVERFISRCFVSCEKLVKLELDNLPIRKLPLLPSSIESLHIANCHALERVPMLSGTLKSFRVVNCPNLTSLSDATSQCKRHDFSMIRMS
jgi:hypothetical protein